MTPQTIIDIGSLAIIATMKIAAPALLAIMITGLIVSIFQAATQINEQTFSFIPKIIAMSIALVVTGPWIINVILTFTRNIFSMIATTTK